jgi:Na+/melibiose symporter-like transporter
VTGSEQRLATGVADTPARYAEVAAERRRLGLPLYSGEVLAGVSAMSIARGSVGFVAFFLAFALRREHAATWWFGILLVASGAGSLIGSIAVPRLRRFLTERSIIAGSLFLIALGSIVAGVIGGRWAQVMLTFVVGIGPTAAKAALDSIVQRNVPPALLGRTFGRIETRLQLVWVGASLVAVVIPFPLRVGDAVIAVACVLAALAYTSGAAPDRYKRRRAAVEPSPGSELPGA